MISPSTATRLTRGTRMLFVSDVHLTPSEPEVFLAFVRFLREVAAGSRALYLLGDIFDFWVGDRQAEMPGFREVFREIARLRESGTEVFFLPGNRDFALEEPFAGAHGLRVLPDVARAAVGDRHVLLTHGDLLCTRDHAYHRMRRIIRSRPARAVLRRLPLRLALAVAGGLRRTSGRAVRGKPGWILEPDFEEAVSWLETGHDALIFGHVHRAAQYRVRREDGAAEIFVLGAWADGPNHVEWDGERLALRTGPTASRAASGK